MVPNERHLLFLCTGNSARSIMAESILRARGKGQYRVNSAGSDPAGTVNPYALKRLQYEGFPTAGLRSKSWDEFAADDPVDIVITVCDTAAGAQCPAWSGSPVTAHWAIPDPAAAPVSAATAAFEQAFRQLSQCVDQLLRLPQHAMSQAEFRRALRAIGRQVQGV